MKPNDKAIEAALLAAKTVLRNDEITIDSAIFAALDAAYAAQFQSEDYAGLIKDLRTPHGRCLDMRPDAADAIETLLAEREAWKGRQEATAAILKQVETERDALKAELAAGNEWIQARAKTLEELAMVRAERDALAARLAPVEDESRHLTTEEQKVFNSALRRSAKIKKPVDDKALVEIVAREIAFAQGDVESPNSEFMDENWHCWEPEARAAIAAIRPHIEAAERERCAKIAETPDLWVTDKPTRGCDDIATAIRSGK